MSLFSKWRGSKAPEPSPVTAAAPPAAAKPRPDRSADIAAEESRLTEALASGDTDTLAQIALAATSTRLRQRAAQAVADPERVRELIRLSRGKDSAVYRILTEKRDAWLEVERKATALQTEIDSVAAGIARHAPMPFDAIYEATLREQERRWQTLAAQASAETRERVEADLARAHAVVRQHYDAIAADAAARAAAHAAAQAAIASEHQAAAEAAATALADATLLEASQAEAAQRAESDAETVRALVGLLRQLQGALERGGSARAARLRATLEARRNDIDPAILPAWFARQLTQADEALEKLKDWLAFTAGPKRAELIERMQSLVGAEIAPEQLAIHIRKLQEEWRTLHRGAGEDDSEEEERFKALANKAYEPCKVHFAAKAAQRAENRAHREALLTRLAEYTTTLTGDSPNWRRVIQTLVEARREWRQYAPVDQDIAEALQARFKATMEGISALLDAETGRNVAARRALIDEAQSLLQLEDVRQAIDRAKALQRSWKSVGVVPREQDNALWEEFRGHCNAVFERSASEAAAYDAALSAAAARAAELVREVESIAELTGDALREGMRRGESLQQEFEQLDLPRAQARDLRQRFGRAADRCQDALQADRARAQHTAWASLLTAAGDIRAYAHARGNGADEATLAARAADIAALLDTLQGAPKSAKTTLARHWEHVQSTALAASSESHEAQLRLLCIRAELAFDMETPAEDVEKRREYQMQRLLQSRNLGADFEPVSLEDLTLEWLTVGTVDPAAEAGLRERFERCKMAARRSRTRD